MVDSKSFGLNSLYILTDIFFAVNTDLFAIPFDFLCNRDVGVYLSGWCAFSITGAYCSELFDCRVIGCQNNEFTCMFAMGGHLVLRYTTYVLGGLLT